MANLCAVDMVSDSVGSVWDEIGGASCEGDNEGQCGAYGDSGDEGGGGDGDSGDGVGMVRLPMKHARTWPLAHAHKRRRLTYAPCGPQARGGELTQGEVRAEMRVGKRWREGLSEHRQGRHVRQCVASLLARPLGALQGVARAAGRLGTLSGLLRDGSLSLVPVVSLSYLRAGASTCLRVGSSYVRVGSSYVRETAQRTHAAFVPKCTHPTQDAT